MRASPEPASPPRVALLGRTPPRGKASHDKRPPDDLSAGSEHGADFITLATRDFDAAIRFCGSCWAFG
ncbi:MAG TPA: hypothetical protein VE780_05910, partial [Thermoleophilaceae bacterium]|nr:hypothetical protein [Thermoleophilaceae bacterium]